MIKLKNEKELDIMRQGGKILSAVVSQVVSRVRPGVTTVELDLLAENLIAQAGGRPSFKGYKTSWSRHPFPGALCISINNEVVHGLPVPSRTIELGDVVGIDCGLEYQGMFTDMAKTVIVGSAGRRIKHLVELTEEALMRGIKQVKPGNTIFDVSKTIYDHIDNAGFFVVTQLVGHGVGFSIHEDPQIPNYVDDCFPNHQLELGMTFAIEPMANSSCVEVHTLDDGWTVVTDDGGVSAHFEHTVAVTKTGYEILTK